MRAERSQTTLAGPCTVSGRGYWTGQVNALTFLPAPAGTGIRFVRADLEGRPSVLALAEKRATMPLRTRLIQGRAEVDMVEHVMAALFGLGIDNAVVQCTTSEMPAMDGSSFAFALALQAAGTLQLSAPRQTLWIDRKLRVGDEMQWIEAEPLHDSGDGNPQPMNRLELEYQLDFGPHSPIARHNRSITLNPQDFFEQLSAARTFITAETAQLLQSRGLARHVTDRDLLVFGADGPVNNCLRYADECARHKLLDLVGDLALTGMDLVGRITASRGGHQLNGEMAASLRDLAVRQLAEQAERAA